MEVLHRQSSSLKDKLINLSKILKDLKEKKNVEKIKKLIPSMKTLKTEYEDTTTRHRHKMQTYLRCRSELESKRNIEVVNSLDYDYSKMRQFECSVENLSALPIDQLSSLGRDLMSVIANANKLKNVKGLVDLCCTRLDIGKDAAPVVLEEEDGKRKQQKEIEVSGGPAILEWLSLRDNHLETLEGVAPLLCTLEHLSIEMNRVTSLSGLLSFNGGAPSSLRTLLASNNQINDLDPLCSSSGRGEAAVPTFACLETVALYRNKISSIPKNFTLSLPNLRHLDLGRNQIRWTSHLRLEQCPLLETLILYENQVGRIMLCVGDIF